MIRDVRSGSQRDRIIEIATLVTDANLNILAEGPTIAVHQSDEQLALMDDWNVRTHTASGLVERVKAARWAIGS
ncbi:exonuclease domain-containing protein [Escherichia coli]